MTQRNDGSWQTSRDTAAIKGVSMQEKTRTVTTDNTENADKTPHDNRDRAKHPKGSDDAEPRTEPTESPEAATADIDKV
jgi:hypothetical protein